MYLYRLVLFFLSAKKTNELAKFNFVGAGEPLDLFASRTWTRTLDDAAKRAETKMIGVRPVAARGTRPTIAGLSEIIYCLLNAWLRCLRAISLLEAFPVRRDIVRGPVLKSPPGRIWIVAG